MKTEEEHKEMCLAEKVLSKKKKSKTNDFKDEFRQSNESDRQGTEKQSDWVGDATMKSTVQGSLMPPNFLSMLHGRLGAEPAEQLEEMQAIEEIIDDKDSQETDSDEDKAYNKDGVTMKKFLGMNNLRMPGAPKPSRRALPKKAKKVGFFDAFKKNYEAPEEQNQDLDESWATIKHDEDLKSILNPEDDDMDIQERLQIIKDLTLKADQKDKMILDQNIVSLAVLSLFKPNRRKL